MPGARRGPPPALESPLMDLQNLDRLHAAHVAQLQKAPERVLQQPGLDARVTPAGGARLRVSYDDNYWPLRPTLHFHHWLPLAESGCALVVWPGKKLLLFWPKELNF